MEIRLLLENRLRAGVVRHILQGHMKTCLMIMGLLLARTCPWVGAQTEPRANADKPKEAVQAKADAAAKQEAVEAKFKALLTKATLRGRWCPVMDGVMSPDKEDTYLIESVNKLGGDLWIINARIQYAQKDFVAPIPMRIAWAGDTAIMMVTDVGLPGGAKYSARIMFYENTYSGTWSGGDHGGLMHGLISRQ